MGALFVISLVALTALVTGCAGEAPPAREPWENVRAVPKERPICGWEEVDRNTPPLPILPKGDARVAPGASVAVIAPTPATSFADVRLALAPADASLIRIKLVVRGRWLLPTTHPKRQPTKPPPSERVTRVVGRRRITRRRGQPADRFAALRVRGDSVTVFVENDNQQGRQVAISALGDAIRALDPPARVFAVTATDETPWSSVETAVIAAGCHDRKPGDEPHEVILD